MCSGSAPGVRSATRACPASWTATMRRSASASARLRRAGPSSTRSAACSRSAASMRARASRAASTAASLTSCARSAPDMPPVRPATAARSTSGARGLPRACRARIASRSTKVGRPTWTRRSKRPGRSRAGSSVSGRLVAAMTTTPARPSSPSMQVRSWATVWECSRSPPVPPATRACARASISSRKTMQGAARRASSKRRRTRMAPRPTNISVNSEPEACMKGTPASPASAAAIRVLPLPGGP